jgi:hypothetical protein
MRNSNTTYQDRVNTIVERDSLTSDNLRALNQVTDNRLRFAECQADSDRALQTYQSVRDWLIKAALRRHRKEVAAATGPLNNTLAALTVGRIKARRFNGSKG